MRAPCQHHDRPHYHLAFAVSGAALGGIYSAGVLDFLLEALSEGERAHDSGLPNASPWGIHLTDLVGTSSGGITAALALSLLSTDYEPLRADFDPSIHPPPHNNVLYDLWVRRACVDAFLRNDDLGGDHIRRGDRSCWRKPKPRPPVLRSLANADAIRTLAHCTLDKQRGGLKKHLFAQGVRLTLTSTNLSGVPYVARAATTASSTNHELVVTQHADHTTFDTSALADGVSAYALDSSALRSSGPWRRVISCMAATAAYPVLLAPVALAHRRTFYNNRYARKPTWPEDGVDSGGGSDDEKRMFDFVAIDGMLNTKPYDLAELALRRTHGEGCEPIECAPSSAWGSVVLVDPFPPQEHTRSTRRDADQMGLLSTMRAAWSATKSQGSFKHEQVARALDAGDLSTFLIAPDQKAGVKIASRPLGNAASVVDESLRLHDFMLGRRDCQRFLRDVLVLSREDATQNPIFVNGDKLADARGRVPIVPLCGSAAVECITPAWPSLAADKREHAKELVRRRADRVIDVAAENAGLLGRASWYQLHLHVRNLGVRLALAQLKRSVYASVDSNIDDALIVFPEPK